MKKIISLVLVVILAFSTLAVGANAASLRRLDLAFVIDTTGSMSGDIYQVKQDMKAYLDDLSSSGMDYRIAVIDYRDFESRGSYGDYPYCVQLDFSNDYDAILNAINSLSLGNGGDTNETICSALIDGLSELSWRSEAGKAAILMGDAPALDPEPYTGYTKDDVINYLSGRDIGYEEEMRSTLSLARDASVSEIGSPVTLFTIATSTSSLTTQCFEYLANGTGGKSYVASDSAEITEIIEEIIDVIPEVVEDEELTFWDYIVRFFEIIWYVITFQWDKI